MHLCYIHCLLSHDLLCDCSLNANMFLCHLFSPCLILLKSLSFHMWVHFSSLSLNAFISQPDSDGGARVFKAQHCWWGNRWQQIFLKPFNRRFLVCSWARNSSLERHSRSSSRFPSATHHSASLLWPPAPNFMLRYTVEEWQGSRCVSAGTQHEGKWRAPDVFSWMIPLRFSYYCLSTVVNLNSL